MLPAVKRVLVMAADGGDQAVATDLAGLLDRSFEAAIRALQAAIADPKAAPADVIAASRELRALEQRCRRKKLFEQHEQAALALSQAWRPANIRKSKKEKR